PRCHWLICYDLRSRVQERAAVGTLHLRSVVAVAVLRKALLAAQDDAALLAALWIGFIRVPAIRTVRGPLRLHRDFGLSGELRDEIARQFENRHPAAYCLAERFHDPGH